MYAKIYHTGWKLHGFLIYGAVAIHSVQTQGKLLARFSGPREDVFVLSASWCGNGAVGNRLCWVRSGIAFFSSTSSTLAKVSMRLCHQKVTVPKHALRRQLARHWRMHLFSQSGWQKGFYQLHKLGRSMTINLNSHNALMHKLGKTMLCGALSAKWLQLKHSGVGSDLPLVRQLPGTLNILVPKK